MRDFNRKIKAFTIAEMLVVLVISGIMVSLAMLILSLVQKQINGVNSNYGYNTEIRLLERALWQDFNRHSLFYNDKKQLLLCTSEIDTVKYVFETDFVIRNTDTLKIPVSKASIYLNGIMVKGGHIDAVELQISRQGADKAIFVYKTKDAAYYVNQ